VEGHTSRFSWTGISASNEFGKATPKTRFDPARIFTSVRAKSTGLNIMGGLFNKCCAKDADYSDAARAATHRRNFRPQCGYSFPRLPSSAHVIRRRDGLLKIRDDGSLPNNQEASSRLSSKKVSFDDSHVSSRSEWST